MAEEISAPAAFSNKAILELRKLAARSQARRKSIVRRTRPGAYAYEELHLAAQAEDIRAAARNALTGFAHDLRDARSGDEYGARIGKAKRSTHGTAEFSSETILGVVLNGLSERDPQFKVPSAFAPTDEELASDEFRRLSDLVELVEGEGGGDEDAGVCTYLLLRSYVFKRLRTIGDNAADYVSDAPYRPLNRFTKASFFTDKLIGPDGIAAGVGVASRLDENIDTLLRQSYGDRADRARALWSVVVFLRTSQLATDTREIQSSLVRHLADGSLGDAEFQVQRLVATRPEALTALSTSDFPLSVSDAKILSELLREEGIQPALAPDRKRVLDREERHHRRQRSHEQLEVFGNHTFTIAGRSRVFHWITPNPGNKEGTADFPWDLYTLRIRGRGNAAGVEVENVETLPADSLWQKISGDERKRRVSLFRRSNGVIAEGDSVNLFEFIGANNVDAFRSALVVAGARKHGIDVSS